MQVLLLFPLAFLAGMDGFAIFAPYLVLIVLLGHLLQKRRRAAAVRSAAGAQSLFSSTTIHPEKMPRRV
ncbi:MAG TPA: hypothetical protein VG269_01370 [Tepidisphaeraceae bacterium]|jgi:hypothetical protein|nr:hypothetical protein [Tepidisphaeraceae bacterium]